MDRSLHSFTPSQHEGRGARAAEPFLISADTKHKRHIRFVECSTAKSRWDCEVDSAQFSGEARGLRSVSNHEGETMRCLMRIDALIHGGVLVVSMMPVVRSFVRSGGWVDGEEELRLLDVAIFWGYLLPALDPEDVP